MSIKDDDPIWYSRKCIALPLENLVGYLLQNHQLLQFSTKEILQLNYTLEAIRALPQFIQIPEVVITISKTFQIAFTGSAITATYSESTYSEGAGYDSHSGESFSLHPGNIDDFDYIAIDVEGIIEEYKGWISLTEPNVVISGADIEWITAGLPSVAATIAQEEEWEATAELAIEQQEIAAEKETIMAQFGAGRYNPEFVILWCFSRYLLPAQLKDILIDLGKSNRQSAGKFLSICFKYLDIELLQTQPVAWQDIWVYNYIKYDFKGKFRWSQLLANYEREVIKKIGRKH